MRFAEIISTQQRKKKKNLSEYLNSKSDLCWNEAIPRMFCVQICCISPESGVAHYVCSLYHAELGAGKEHVLMYFPELIFCWLGPQHFVHVSMICSLCGFMQQLFIYCHVNSEKDLVIVPAKVCVRLEICMCTQWVCIYYSGYVLGYNYY